MLWKTISRNIMCVFYWAWSSPVQHSHVVCILPVDGKWQPWSLWSGCSKTCGGGSQQRNRVCYGPFFGGQPCPGEREEVRRCNEKRCPGQLLIVFFTFYMIQLYEAHLPSFCEQNLMKFVVKKTSPTLYGRWLQLGIQQQYAALPMPWVSSHLSIHNTWMFAGILRNWIRNTLWW